MKIVKIFCDRCGKEIKGYEEHHGVFGELIGRDNTSDIEICLCGGCTNGLKKFLEGIKND